MPEEIVIKAENVSKDFILPHEKVNSIKSIFTGSAKLRGMKEKETQHALRGVSFEIKKGEFFGVVGRNGSGKSTLLKILAGIYQPTSGKVYTSGKLVPFIELGVGFNPELTGRENIYLNGALLGFSEKEIDLIYDDIVSFAELKRFMDQKLKNYSSGMQVRLAFSMAIRAQADILLLDEVLAVGDADFQRKCFNYFSKLKDQDTTVIFISHDMAAVREYCDRAMLINESEIVDIGETDKIAQEYLRLFMDDGTASGAAKKSDRWGDKSMRIENVSTSVNKETITIAITVKASKAFAKPIVGFRIKDATGKEVTGTNTRRENRPLPDLNKGEVLKTTWQMANILADGEYIVDIALQYPDEITVADWWNGASEIKISKEKHLPYTIDPGFELTVDR